MRRAIHSLVIIGGILAAPSLAMAGLNVIFVQPEHFSDPVFHAGSTREAALNGLRSYLDSLGARYLGPDQSLTIQILDVTFAGRTVPQRAGSDLRVLNSVTPPRFKLRYVFTPKKGRAPVTGDETLSDMNYLSNPAAATSTDRFVYEKDMLADWFRNRFVRSE